MLGSRMATNNLQGKQLVGIFKEAQAAYRDRREAIKAERGGIRRAKTFDVTQHRDRDPYQEEYHYGRYADEVDYVYDRQFICDGVGRRRSYDGDDGDRSLASSRYSRHTKQSRRPRALDRALPALTEGNLKTHSEVSATSPSKAYRSPYAETAPRDMQVSRPTLAIGPAPPPMALHGSSALGAVVAAQPERQHLAHRPRSDLAPVVKKKKSIDMNLAYGDIPPDLASRVDLDPDHQHLDSEPEDPQEARALTIMDRIEEFLEQAHCVHYTASSMIESLQRNPEAAAAVALSLAELSALLGKMSPAFLAFLKGGGSPAVFALLASPQFLIGAGVAVGVTVVMFGGWKIVKRIKDSAAAEKTLETPFAAVPALPTAAGEKPLPVPGGAVQPASAASYDEALVLQDVEELSTIESWRRGIVPFGEDEVADVELMSREAERALRAKHNRDLDEVEPCDSVSQVSRAKTDRSKKSHRSYRSSRHRKEVDVPLRKSSKKDKDGGDSEAASERSYHSSRNGKSRGRHDGSTVSRSSKHASSIGLRAVEGGGEEESGSAAGKPKEKKRDMIKQLFKMKKDKEDREKIVSVLV